ncbi:TPA: nitrile hydratase accessory protein [Klebsiella variicola]|uniref:nitrile hydratase accessory protein n=1 Tax=Klebsiella pneumoniae TaxID=573 RepID=UPI0015EA3806|nr:nitrile hydratase accessory protein [Klebsiella pneumoniae]EIY5386273.1 nitrile hydratase accessory protein [Klebsiella variicola]MDU4203450.1 nitrile hydratase accessory protein [Negativicoccus succinicivorans]MDU4248814.1 nitrile hydratase accessory protein [Thomasclavelia ramosa]QLR70898.1 nitrile hydratase accessory protein [Klebsiella pneumoniae]QLR70982.1 nitrile hydratase accessory protein [Klebsiella pneumoniae]
MNSSELLQLAISDKQILQSIAFPNPWAARAFGLTLAAVEKKLFTLQMFQQALIALIASSEAQGHPIADEEHYYTCWVEALTSLLNQASLIVPGTLEEQEHEIREHTHQMHLHQDAHFPPRPLVIVEGQ